MPGLQHLTQNPITMQHMPVAPYLTMGSPPHVEYKRESDMLSTCLFYYTITYRQLHTDYYVQTMACERYGVMVRGV